ncbi:MAG TPA: DUF3106 domain-containing protein [Candidatus Paceibacterota bacterium]|nr:DUF3106 domain-containing protein [Candidatus Paceibacterota bacterium]
MSPWRQIAGAALAALVLLPGFGSRAEPAATGAGAPPPLPAAPLPLPPPPRSPVDLFRELLAMTPAERRAHLTNRPPASQKLILAKLREYESMRPDVRELRLQATELRWYLLPLMSLPATNRPSQLALIPPEFRDRVEARLRMWDQLDPAVQKELLDNEAAIRHFSELEGSSDEQRRRLLEGMSEARRKKLQAGIDQWQALPETQRRQITARFNQFFDLTPAEKQKALNILSDAERRQIDKTLRAYGTLGPQERALCLQSFEKFTRLSLEERQKFLKNAERWKLMTPDERQAWRDLVARLSNLPPLPPGFHDPPPLPGPPPPMPGRRTLAVTNRN